MFYPLMWPVQAMGLEEKRLVLPMGRGRASLVMLRPDWLTEKAACRIVWNGVHNELPGTRSEPDAQPTDPATLEVASRHATVDLGQIHQVAVATSTGEALVVSGRGIRSVKRQHSRQLGQIARKRSRCQKGSRRWKKLGTTRAKLTLRCERRIRDLRHKGTRQVVDFSKAHALEAVFIGNPDGVRRKNCGRDHNQRMSQWEYGRDGDYLQQKAEQDRIVHCGPHGPCFIGDERGTSSQHCPPHGGCPVCGHRHKPRGRNWRCKACGFEDPRDIVGAVNMHPIA